MAGDNLHRSMLDCLGTDRAESCEEQMVVVEPYVFAEVQYR